MTVEALEEFKIWLWRHLGSWTKIITN